MRALPLIAALSACASRPDPVPAHEAGAVALLDVPFAEIVVPADNRGGVFPPDSVALGPWTVVAGTDGWQRWEAKLPVRVRSLFYFAPPEGMRVLDDAGERVKHYG